MQVPSSDLELGPNDWSHMFEDTTKTHSCYWQFMSEMQNIFRSPLSQEIFKHNNFLKSESSYLWLFFRSSSLPKSWKTEMRQRVKRRTKVVLRKKKTEMIFYFLFWKPRRLYESNICSSGPTEPSLDEELCSGHLEVNSLYEHDT